MMSEQQHIKINTGGVHYVPLVVRPFHQEVTIVTTRGIVIAYKNTIVHPYYCTELDGSMLMLQSVTTYCFKLSP